jgi:hypothetical protein
VLTDAWGDLPQSEDILSDEQLGKVLGPTWKLVDEESYVHAYEWRPYLFSKWRTRVWQKVQAPAAGAAASRPAIRGGIRP